MGSDMGLICAPAGLITSFNPRSPHGERLFAAPSCAVPTYVSIHAPRMGSDTRKPCLLSANIWFQSTLPAWGATISECDDYLSTQVSIHAPRMGSDSEAIIEQLYSCIVSIHAPRMGSDYHRFALCNMNLFVSIHAPRMGSDASSC